MLVLITLGNGSLFSGLTVRAAEEEQIELDETPQIELDETPVENEYVPDVDDQDPSRLFNGYVDQVFHDQVRMKSGRKLAPRNNASKLKGMNLQVYTRLYEGICAVAAGERESTVFTVELSDLDIQTSWTAEELGVSSLITETDSGKVISAEAKEAVKNLLGLDVPLVIQTMEIHGRSSGFLMKIRTQMWCVRDMPRHFNICAIYRHLSMRSLHVL